MKLQKRHARPVRPIVGGLLALLLAAPLALGGHTDQDERARLELDAARYAWPLAPYADAVCFTWTNTGTTTLLLPSGAPWAILDENGRVVYAPASSTSFKQMPPGSSQRGCWGGKDVVLDEAVMPGAYEVSWTYVSWSGGTLRPYELRAGFDLEGPT